MKLLIPPEINVGPLTFQIVFNEKLLKKMHDRASANVTEQKIRLPRETSDEQCFVLLIHELDHAAEDNCGIDFNEQNTCSRSSLIAQALMSMGLEPDFSQIPEEKL